jgi:hypothetical protein
MSDYTTLQEGNELIRREFAAMQMSGEIEVATLAGRVAAIIDPNQFSQPLLRLYAVRDIENQIEQICRTGKAARRLELHGQGTLPLYADATRLHLMYPCVSQSKLYRSLDMMNEKDWLYNIENAAKLADGNLRHCDLMKKEYLRRKQLGYFDDDDDHPDGDSPMVIV